MVNNRLKKPRKRTIAESCQTPTPVEVWRAAMAYRKAGLSLIPIAADQNKRPAFSKLPEVWCEHRQKHMRSWSMFKDRRPTPQEILKWFRPTSADSPEYGLAIVAGRVSGGLEIIDLDTYDLVEPFRQEVDRRSPGLYAKLVAVRTPRPGLHLYYRCETHEGNQKLARVKVAEGDGGKWKTVIETRGEGGYCLAPPSPAGCHPGQACYTFEDGKDFRAISTITPAERTTLFEVARSFDEPQSSRSTTRRNSQRASRANHGLRPGDDYNQRAEWAAILEPHGWVYAGTGSGGAEHWTRPGKSEGTSATTNHADLDLLFVFSQNADPFEADRTYTKFAAFALLEHDGHFAQAACELRRQGYGEQITRSRTARRRLRRPSVRLRRNFRP